ncbi:Helix-turn-helix domain protein [Rubinisphaera italica]|uniref:Helix-turn-helix domain protein n=2 Tax=Rubinisphaera italica TaxID=2527969 RepID=A0A5C5XML5_9PLAN|nr:Helix-turn-helix domain protein [Rubinisphaera italica]
MSRNGSRNIASKTEIERAVQAFRKSDPTVSKFGMTVDQFARELNVARKTLYEWIQKGRFDGTFRKRGKHIYFWPEKTLDRFYNGPDWR